MRPQDVHQQRQRDWLTTVMVNDEDRPEPAGRRQRDRSAPRPPVLRTVLSARWVLFGLALGLLLAVVEPVLGVLAFLVVIGVIAPIVYAKKFPAHHRARPGGGHHHASDQHPGPSPGPVDEDGRLRRRFASWLHRPVRRWQAMLITIVFGPLALVTTLVGMVAFVPAPPMGALLLFGSLAPWFLVFVAWRMVGADPATLERPKDVARRRRREARSGGRPGLTARPVEGLAVGAVDAAAGEGWRTIVASLAFGKPVAQALRVVFRVEPGSRAALARLVVPVLRGLQDAGVFPPGAGSEVLIAEKATDDASPGVDITLITLAEAVSTSPPGPGAVTVASAAWPDAQITQVAPSPAETPTGELSGQPLFVDVAVRDHRSLQAVIPAGVDAVLAALAAEGGVPGAERSGEQVTWLRFQRTSGLPVPLVGAAGPVAAAAVDEPRQHFPTVPLAPRPSSGSEVAAAGHNDPGLYRCAELRTTPLAMTPRLASWDAKDAPSQRRLSAYLDHLEDVVGLDQYDPDVPFGLILEVGLGRPLTADDRGYDLDNYLYPVASRLGANRFTLFRASKSAAPTSSISVGPAIAADVIDTTWSTATASTTTSASSKAWKQQVISQLESQMPEPPSSTPVELELAFQVGARRNWANLWKQAIDSLGPILGVPDPARPFAPRDDLIVALGLHRTVNPPLANNVRMQVWWRPARR